MSDLALEIKKLADKYRNNKKTGLLDIDDSGQGEFQTNNKYFDVSNDDSNEFDNKKLDFLEQEIDDFENFTISMDEDLSEEENNADHESEVKKAIEERYEIQISDFINPAIDVANFSLTKKGDDFCEDGDFGALGDRKSASENLRIISRNLRDLKALLRS